MWDKIFILAKGAGRLASKVIKILVTGIVILSGIALLVFLILVKMLIG